MTTSSPPGTGTRTPRLGAPLKLLLVLGSVTALGPMAIDFYLPALPSVAAQLGTSQSAVQLTLTGCLAGLALGQLAAGPLADRFGRRRPLLLGTAGYAVFSLLCGLAPNVEVLLSTRFLQGLSGAFGAVVARAVVRDLASGAAAARLFSVLMLVVGLAPVLAPTLGGQLLTLTDWRGLFTVLAVLGAVMVFAVGLWLPETLPGQRRSRSGPREVLRTYWALLHDRVYLGYALTLGLAFASLFSYVSGSPFVYQQIYEVSAQTYGLLFGLNSIGLIAVTQLNGALVGRVAPRKLLTIGVLSSTTGGVWLVIAALSQPASVAWIAAPLFVVVSSLGVAMPNAMALGLSDYPHIAGTASALLGAIQFAIGAAAGPLVGLAGSGSALPMALIILTLGVAACTALLSMTRPARTPTAVPARA